MAGDNLQADKIWQKHIFLTENWPVQFQAKLDSKLDINCHQVKIVNNNWKVIYISIEGY